MTVEQKAKAYDEAIKRIQSYVVDEYGCTRIKVVNVFPELKESEDEKIRNGLIGYFRAGKCENISSYHGISTNDILAWLKKQGEQKHILPELKESEDERIRKNLIELLLDVPSQDIINHHLSLSEVLAWIEKHEWKPSDIQIKALKIVKDYIVFNNWNDCVCNTLKNLLEQLKKL